jgi:hypothetical protein
MKNMSNYKILVQDLLKDENNIKVRTFKIVDNDPYFGEPSIVARVTCASEKISDDEFLLEFSFCSPKDHYCKSYGQFVALSRLINGNKQIRVCKGDQKFLEPIIKEKLQKYTARNVPWLNKMFTQSMMTRYTIH